MTTNEEDRINMDAEAQIDSTILKLAEQYADLENRAKELNDEKKQIRKNAEAIGISSLAWQIGVRTVKLMDKEDRAKFERGLRRVTSALGDRQKELWPEEAERIRKRAEKAAAKAAGQPRSETELNAQTDSSERSDPAAGGAKPQTIKEAAAASDAAVAALVEEGKKGPQLKVVGSEPGQMAPVPGTSMAPPNPPGEAEEGDAALNAGLAETKKSQSQIAAEKRAAAKVP